MNNDAPKLPKLSTLIIGSCTNIGHIISSNSKSLKRMVLDDFEGAPFAPSPQGENQRTLSAASTFNNLEFLQISEPMGKDEDVLVSLTSILKQCPKLKTLITQDTSLIVSNTDVIDKVTFLALQTSISREGHGEEVTVRAGIVKIKADQYMIKALSTDQDLNKMKAKLNMYEDE